MRSCDNTRRLAKPNSAIHCATEISKDRGEALLRLSFVLNEMEGSNLTAAGGTFVSYKASVDGLFGVLEIVGLRVAFGEGRVMFDAHDGQ